jgi:hypothetical protein
MKRGRRLLIALGVAVLILAVLVTAWLVSERSLIIIENRSLAPLTLSVETVDAGQFSWTGELAPRRRVLKFARVPDDSFVVMCRDESGIHRTRGGHVAPGRPQRIDIVAASCGAVQIDVRTIP